MKGDLLFSSRIFGKKNKDQLDFGRDALTATKTKQLASRLEQSRVIAIEKIAEVFGLRPVHQENSENAKSI